MTTLRTLITKHREYMYSIIFGHYRKVIDEIMESTPSITNLTISNLGPMGISVMDGQDLVTSVGGFKSKLGDVFDMVIDMESFFEPELPPTFETDFPPTFGKLYYEKTVLKMIFNSLGFLMKWKCSFTRFDESHAHLKRDLAAEKECKKEFEEQARKFKSLEKTLRWKIKTLEYEIAHLQAENYRKVNENIETDLKYKNMMLEAGNRELLVKNYQLKLSNKSKDRQIYALEKGLLFEESDNEYIVGECEEIQQNLEE